MQKWELNAKVVFVSLGQATNIWLRKDKKTGRADWDQLKDLAAQGWELVGVTAVNCGIGASTDQLLYTFKRPIEEGS